MFGKITKFIMGGVLAICLVSCDETNEPVIESIEQDRLIRTFKSESPEVQKKIVVIIEAAKKRQYQEALNELALLSATRRLNKEQKNAIELIAKQLRYDMEEEIFKNRADRSKE